MNEGPIEEFTSYHGVVAQLPLGLVGEVHVWMSKRRYLTLDELPEWLKGNEFLQAAAHRRPGLTVLESLRSVLELHNEVRLLLRL